MIKSKEDYKYYLKCDKEALGKEYNRPRWLFDDIWRFQIYMRKCEYYQNCRKDFIGKIYLYYLKYRFIKLSHKLGYSIPYNFAREGLSLVHYGTVVINNNAKVGCNCRIHEGVTIGANGKNPNAATIGNNVYIASGAKIIGEIRIEDGVVIGANAVVVKDIVEPNTTWAGAPARKISDNNSDDYLMRT